jgi:hypothetical protein
MGPAYDRATDKVVLFGGVDGTAQYGHVGIRPEHRVVDSKMQEGRRGRSPDGADLWRRHPPDRQA